MKKILILTLVCFCLFSCKKKHTVKIKAINKVTGVPVPNADVFIIEETNKVEGIGGGTITHNFYSGKTNENGELYVTKKFDKRYHYKVWLQTIDKTGTGLAYSYYFYGGDDDPAFDKEILFEVVPRGFLKLSIHNVNCQGATDTMRFRSRYSYSDWEGWSSYRTGCYVYDDPGGGVKVPMGWRYYQWEVIRNGSVNYYIDSVFIPENDTVWFILNY